MKEPRGPDLGNAHCKGCGWSIDLHPFDAEGVDVGRCPTDGESAVIAQVVESQERQLRLLAQAFPRAGHR